MNPKTLSAVFKGKRDEWHGPVLDQLEEFCVNRELDDWILPTHDLIYEHLYRLDKQDSAVELFDAVKTIFPGLKRPRPWQLKKLSKHCNGLFQFARYRARDLNDEEHNAAPVLCGTCQIDEYVQGEPFLRFYNRLPFEKDDGNSAPNGLKGIVIPVDSSLYFVGTEESTNHPIFFSIGLRRNEKLEEAIGMLTRRPDAEVNDLISGRLFFKRTKLKQRPKRDRGLPPKLGKPINYEDVVGFYSEDEFQQFFDGDLKNILNLVTCDGADMLKSRLR